NPSSSGRLAVRQCGMKLGSRARGGNTGRKPSRPERSYVGLIGPTKPCEWNRAQSAMFEQVELCTCCALRGYGRSVLRMTGAFVMSIFKKYGFAWVTIGFLIISLVGHWVFGWLAYVDDATTHQTP